MILVRDRFAESQRLHRARRAGEVRRFDQALCRADFALQGVKNKLALALLACQRGRHDAPERIADAVRAAEDARLALRAHFDESGR